ncbi:MAG: PIN domain-containing protein [Candidatus Thermoplasmatota archaeon]
MKTDGVVFDAWAWFEVLDESPVGQRLWRYIHDRTVVTPALAVAEVARVLHKRRGIRDADEFVKAARIRTRIQPLDDDIAALAGQLHQHLRKRDRNASLADAVMLATARTLGIPLISRDPCFKGCQDVRAE